VNQHIDEITRVLLSVAYSQGETNLLLERYKDNFDEKALKKFSEVIWYLVERGDFAAAETLIDVTYTFFDDPYIKGRILIFKGNLEFRKENYKQAITLFRKAQDYLKSHRIESTLAEMNIGIALQRLQKIPEAITIFKKTYTIFRKEDLNMAAASAVQNLGDLYQEQSLHKKALSCYKKARTIYDIEGNSVDSARVEMSMGVSLHNTNHFADALHAFDHALSVFLENEFFLDAAHTHLNRAVLLIVLRRLDEAEESLTTAEDIFVKADLYGSTASVLLNKALVNRLERRFHSAYELADRAVKTFAACGLLKDSAKALREKAEIALEMGDYKEAEDFLSTSSVILSSEREKALTDIVRVTVLRAAGSYTEALALSEDLLDYFNHPSLERATVLTNYSLLLYELNEFKEGLCVLDEAKKIYESYDIPLKVCDIDMNRGVILFEMSELEEALKTYENIRKTFEDIGMEIEAARVEYNIGNVLRELNDTQNALNRGLHAHEVFSQFNLGRDLYIAKVNLGFTFLAMNEREKSGQYFNPVLEYAQMSKDYHLEYKALYGLGLLEEQKNVINALDYYERAVTTFYRVRTSITSESLRISYLKDKKGIYNRLIRVSLESNQEDVLARYMELFKSRTIYEKVTGSHEEVSVQQVQDYLSGDEVVLNYYVLSDKVIIGSITHDDFQVRSSPLKELYKMCLELQAKLFLRSSRLSILERLYHVLISPVEDIIRGKNICYCPHDLLHVIPFASLFDGTHFLVENHSLAAIPSASLLMTRPHNYSCDTALLVKGPGLKYADNEIDGIKGFFGDSQILSGGAVDQVSENVPRDVVHFACHGDLLPDNPLFSCLNLSDSCVLRAADVLDMDFTGSLVVLSACNTGVSKILAGDEPMGFLRTFLYAGARGIVSSLNVVDDKSTSRLFVEFYRGVKEGKSPSEALQRAQISFIEKGVNPFYWSTFVYMGGLR
jgi:CHAT domain-containing protein